MQTIRMQFVRAAHLTVVARSKSERTRLDRLPALQGELLKPAEKISGINPISGLNRRQPGQSPAGGAKG
ncbi:hypothetical protein [Mameliella sp.]|uniref:hypothetical protein n=1 Tax=Mameliella sp. TaxID=1924940 RepID=UPI003BAC2E19